MIRFPITASSPMAHPGPPPAACDVVVIGGGIIGVMTAWFLAERGLRVTLCEKGRIAGEQSSRNWGWIRQQGRDLAELPIMIESLRHWDGLVQEFGDALGFRRGGVMYLASGQDDLERFARWRTAAQAHGVDTRLLTRAEVAARLPGATADWPGALLTPSDARAEPWVVVPILAGGAVARGATLVENCAVRGLVRSAGRITGVETEHGRIACDHVVLAGGAWSALFARAEGVSLPQLAVRSTAALTEDLTGLCTESTGARDFAFRRHVAGGFLIAERSAHDFFVGPDALRNLRHYLPQLRRDRRSTRFRPAAPSGYPDAWQTPRRWPATAASPFESLRVLDPAPNMASAGRAQDAFARAFPALGRPKLRAVWAGMIDTMPDGVPVIDRVAAIPGLTIATGMCGHGFGIGPGVGRVVADLVAGAPVGHDLHRFRLARFSDGSRIDLGSGL